MRWYVPFFFAILCSCLPICAAKEFLYPVASYKDDDGITKVLVIYQKSTQQVELWQWDPATGRAAKALLSTFAPAGLRMLPDNKGFSFIDSGRIRIKEFCKRSPKSIDIYEPIYDIGVVEWIHNTGYFSAKESSHYRIFTTTTCGTIAPLMSTPDPCSDYLYPYPVNASVFYIERSAHRSAFDAVFLPGTYNEQEQYRYRVMCARAADKAHKPIMLADFGERPIICLRMISEHEGFVIEHSPVISRHDATLTFLYHHLIQDSNTQEWQSTYLFSFMIPAAFLMPQSTTRLYESILPLVPRAIGSSIYYVSEDDDNEDDNNARLCLFKYSSVSGLTQLVSMPVDCDFVPISVASSLFFGGSLMLPEEEDGTKKTPPGDGPQMYLDDQGEIRLSFPSIQL